MVSRYFCNASIAPLRKLDAELDFYPLTADGSPDLASCKGMLEDGQPDIILLVHNFGEPTPAAGLAKFAHEKRELCCSDMKIRLVQKDFLVV